MKTANRERWLSAFVRICRSLHERRGKRGAVILSSFHAARTAEAEDDRNPRGRSLRRDCRWCSWLRALLSRPILLVDARQAAPERRRFGLSLSGRASARHRLPGASRSCGLSLMDEEPEHALGTDASLAVAAGEHRCRNQCTSGPCA
jgi:hypothetical protein